MCGCAGTLLGPHRPARLLPAHAGRPPARRHMAFCSTVGFLCIRVLGLVRSHNMSPADYMQRVFPIGARGRWRCRSGPRRVARLPLPTPRPPHATAAAGAGLLGGRAPHRPPG